MARTVAPVHGTRVAVIGAGSWGTTFAKILADGGADVMLWARRPELAREIQEGKRNSDYLPGINLPLGLRATSRLDLALAGPRGSCSPRVRPGSAPPCGAASRARDS